MKIAKYRHTEYGYESVYECAEWIEKLDSGYVRITQRVSVNFIDLHAAQIVPVEVKALKAEIDKARASFEDVKATIEERIGKLLAITDQSGDSE